MECVLAGTSFGGFLKTHAFHMLLFTKWKHAACGEGQFATACLS